MGFSQQLINNINNLIRDELNQIATHEISLSQLQSTDLWQQTDRLNLYKDEIYQISDRRGRQLILAPTQEEQATYLAKQLINSYKELDLAFFQINNKFRDELRREHGLIRTKEFLMMDAYSFHADQEALVNYYQNIRQAFINIFDQLELTYEIRQTDSGEIGGNFSEEFIAQTSMGEIEIGHIFQLGDRYSKALDAKFQTKENTQSYFQMGCYGIGVTRLFQVIADQLKDEKGLRFSKSINLFDQVIICDRDQITDAIALTEKDQSTLIDDRAISNGRKLKDLELLGIRSQHIFVKEKR